MILLHSHIMSYVVSPQRSAGWCPDSWDKLLAEIKELGSWQASHGRGERFTLQQHDPVGHLIAIFVRHSSSDPRLKSLSSKRKVASAGFLAKLPRKKLRFLPLFECPMIFTALFKSPPSWALGTNGRILFSLSGVWSPVIFQHFAPIKNALRHAQHENPIFTREARRLRRPTAQLIPAHFRWFRGIKERTDQMLSHDPPSFPFISHQIGKDKTQLTGFTWTIHPAHHDIPNVCP